MERRNETKGHGKVAALPKKGEISPLLALLLEKYPPVLDLRTAAALIGYPSVGSIHTAFFRGKLPVRLRESGGRYVFFLSDIVEYLETGVKQEQILGPGRAGKKAQSARRGGCNE